MSFTARAAIALLAGIGAGTIGFGSVWRLLIGSFWDSIPGPGYDAWLLAGIFAPGVLASLAVFHLLSREAARKSA